MSNTLIQINKKSEQRDKNLENIIKKANDIHNNYYNYSLITTYTKMIDKYKIICPEHGEFEQTLHKHLQRDGCKKCGIKKRDNYKKEKFALEFAKKANEIHKEKYTYNSVIYKNATTNIIINCPIHGDFLLTPNKHLNGGGCKKCGHIEISKKLMYPLDQFIEEVKQIHNDKYEYSKVEWKGIDKNIIIICPVHGQFKIKASKHKTNGCQKCRKENTIQYNLLDIDEFIKRHKEKHGEDTYNYSKTIYKGMFYNINITCKNHGEFSSIAVNYSGCNKCKNKTEGIVYNFLCEIFDEVYYQYCPNWAVNEKNNKLRYDFYIPSINIIIELDGDQHFIKDHKWYDNQHEKDIFKTNLANKNGIYIIRITQEEIWNNTFDWKEQLSEIFMDDIKENIFLSESNIYDEHIQLLNESKNNEMIELIFLD
jgi:hypothetical protein